MSDLNHLLPQLEVTVSGLSMSSLGTAHYFAVPPTHNQQKFSYDSLIICLLVRIMSGSLEEL